MRVMVTLLCAGVLAGCATTTNLRSGPPSGAMWGFVVPLDHVPEQPSFAMYAPDLSICEVGRLLVMRRSPAIRHLVPQECQQFFVVPISSGLPQDYRAATYRDPEFQRGLRVLNGAGTIYWMFAMENSGEILGTGGTDRRLCQGIHDNEAQRRGYPLALGPCQTVIIKQLAAD